MSREVRRVPVGWSHPIEANPYWREQEASRLRRGRPESRLHGPTERFVPLHDRDILRYYEEGEELPEEDTLMLTDAHARWYRANKKISDICQEQDLRALTPPPDSDTIEE